MNKKLLLLALLIIVLIIPLYSQDKDTSETDNGWENWDKKTEDDWDKIGSHMFDFKIKGAPTIELNYGDSKMNLKGISNKFSKPGMLELRIGYTTEKSFNGSDYISSYKFKYFHLGNFTTSLSGNQDSNDLISNTWRFGFGWASGYGYDLGKGFSIIPYHQGSFDWTMVNMQSTPTYTNDINMTNLFNKSFRFGNSVQGGIQFKFFNNLGIDASYERSIVYPRHLFWKWGASELIELIGQGLIDKFVEEILDSTPNAVPVVNFLLKNAFSFGIYELKQDKMNWPFETASPLAFDHFKIGITFVL